MFYFFFQKRGFSNVVYWDNQHKKREYKSLDGKIHKTAGEILYVNTKWREDSFRKQLQDRGYYLYK